MSTNESQLQGHREYLEEMKDVAGKRAEAIHASVVSAALGPYNAGDVYGKTRAVNRIEDAVGRVFSETKQIVQKKSPDVASFQIDLIIDSLIRLKNQLSFPTEPALLGRGPELVAWLAASVQSALDGFGRENLPDSFVSALERHITKDSRGRSATTQQLRAEVEKYNWVPLKRPEISVGI